MPSRTRGSRFFFRKFTFTIRKRSKRFISKKAIPKRRQRSIIGSVYESAILDARKLKPKIEFPTMAARTALDFDVVIVPPYSDKYAKSQIPRAEATGYLTLRMKILCSNPNPLYV